MMRDILDDAIKAVTENQKAYGPPLETFAMIAERWSMVLGVDVTPAQVALCMIDLKMVRLLRDPSHYDSAVDVAGYVACLSAVVPVEPVDDRHHSL